MKVLLKCAGRYLRGSGIEDACIETEVFGKLTLNYVLEGTHYVRSFQGLSMFSDVIIFLMWEGFWLWLKQYSHEIDENAEACATELRAALCKKSKCKSPAGFAELLAESDHIQKMFQSFQEECETESELCQFWGVFQQMALHMASVEIDLPIIIERDRERERERQTDRQTDRQTERDR